MQKRGQFYLVAAIIISTIIMSLIVITNYSQKQEYSDLNDLRNEIRIEGASALDNAINSDKTDIQIRDQMRDFTDKYIALESRSKDLYFLFGTRTMIELNGYQKDSHSVNLNGNLISDEAGDVSGTTSGNFVNLDIDGNTHTFEIPDGQSFYFMLSKDIGGGNYVVKG